MSWKRPDWRDASAYPDPKTATRSQWAWEFLRRNPDYIQDFERYLSDLNLDDESAIEDLEAVKDLDAIHEGILPLTKDWCVNGATYPGQMLKDVVASLKTYTIRPTFMIIGESYGISNGLQPPPDPANSEPPVFDVISQQILLPGSVLNDHEISRNQVGLIFNIDLPIDRQLEMAKMQLESRRRYFLQSSRSSVPEKPRLTAIMYQDYLRLLDAIEAGLTISELVTAFLPFEDNSAPDYRARKKIMARKVTAEHIRDCDYLKIVAC